VNVRKVSVLPARV